ncbi:hypothetical protein [Marinicella litoralis]|uniref:Uncharacterized protein n=1 Tax=Marinicella litoralis TaxID=644220 RepID=A0A4R6XIM7_9GAMM|nr:hypothetical protein [Marinicella litoralis]TDR19336.1 hypothetical protein C8D91_1885 [Marinicella litoralis]
MKINISMLEKIGQTQSIQQFDSVDKMFEVAKYSDHAFDKLKAQNNDLVCVLFPDDDDED